MALGADLRSRGHNKCLLYTSNTTHYSPTNQATNLALSPTLSWNAVSGADTYQVQVFTSSGFSSTVLNKSNLTGTSVTASTLAESITQTVPAKAAPGSTAPRARATRTAP
ncbi:hypothetical protein [Pontibacter mangrovi]|uniref:Uncharacterized protein n=1 Tax=Pontibacter mangrovi TaxID=2589816 RepID=A0A501W2H0_9BACT|nr:hypothetical protein [Pontibacter mangrovi]TPE42480.1 hypothetical protein FJM65_17915 [Pontibacter mangrovi]